MRSFDEQQDGPSQHRDLRVLSEVADKPEITQRELSQRVGIALGLTNVLLRNLVQKGYVRANQAGWKRWLYNLTPEGFAHKVRLTVAYVQRVLDHYQKVRQTLREQLEPLALHEESRVAIYGIGEFAELIYLGLKEIGIEEIDIFATNSADNGKFLGMLVLDVATLKPELYDRVIVADLQYSESVRNELERQSVAPEKVVTFFSHGESRRES